MIRLETRGDIAVVTLAKGRGNGLEPTFLGQIAAGIRDAVASEPRGIVLTGEGTVFCAGLDLVTLSGFDRAGMQSVLDGLYDLLVAVFAAPRPVVAAMPGHAIAGGALLALACDRRLLARGPARFGLTEIALGVPMPASTLPILSYSLSRPALETLVLGGQLHDADATLAMGAIDAVVDPADLHTRAVTAIEEWTAHVGVFADVKRRLHAPSLADMSAAHADDGVWLDFWFGADAQARIAGMRERLTRKKDNA